MKCYVCEDVELIWGGDHSGEAYGLEDEDAIITNLSCPQCNSYVEVTHNVQPD